MELALGIALMVIGYFVAVAITKAGITRFTK
jgi:hypothetical protein